MSTSKSYAFESSYEPTYEVIYDWETVLSDLIDEELLENEEDEEEEEFLPEILLPGKDELGEA